MAAVVLIYKQIVPDAENVAMHVNRAKYVHRVNVNYHARRDLKTAEAAVLICKQIEPTAASAERHVNPVWSAQVASAFSRVRRALMIAVETV